MSRLRLAVLSAGALSPEDVRAMAALLVRSGIDAEIVPLRDARGAILWGETADPGLPALRLPRMRRDARIEDCDALARYADGSGPAPDLVALCDQILQGRDEMAAPLDEHGRPAPSASWLLRAGLLERPILDEAARRLGCEAPFGEAQQAPPTFCATLDIDSAGMFRGRAAARNLRELARTNPRGLGAAASLFVRSRIGSAPDPHLRIRQLGELLEGLGVPATFFVQTHRKHRLDSYGLDAAPRLVEQLRAVIANGYHDVGLHSSYSTRDGTPTAKAQWNRLRARLGPELARVHRAHYLRCPRNADYGEPRVLDSSIAYGAAPGFRRGTGLAFELEHGAWEAPPCFMDSTMRYFRRMGPEQATAAAVAMLDRVAACGGCFVPIWHPHNLEELLWPGWLESMLDILAEAKRRGFRFQTLAAAAGAVQASAQRIAKEIAAAANR